MRTAARTTEIRDPAAVFCRNRAGGISPSARFRHRFAGRCEVSPTQDAAARIFVCGRFRRTSVRPPRTDGVVGSRSLADGVDAEPAASGAIPPSRRRMFVRSYRLRIMICMMRSPLPPGTCGPEGFGTRISRRMRRIPAERTPRTENSDIFPVYLNRVGRFFRIFV